MAKNGDGVLVDGSATKRARCPDSCSLRLLRSARAVHRRHDGGSAALELALRHRGCGREHVPRWLGGGGGRMQLPSPPIGLVARRRRRARGRQQAGDDRRDGAHRLVAKLARAAREGLRARSCARAHVVRWSVRRVAESIRDHSPPPAPGRPRNLASSGRGVARVQRCACRVREEQRCKGRGRRHVPRRRVCRRGHVRARRRTSRACGKKLDQSHTSWPLDDRAEGKKISKRPYWGSNPDCMIAGS